MSRSWAEYPGPPSKQNIGQACPIFFVSIDHNGHIGVFTNVSYSFQQERGDLFGFLVNGGVEICTLKGIANGHHQGASPGISGCQMCHTPSAYEFLLLLGQSRASSQDALPIFRTPGPAPRSAPSVRQPAPPSPHRERTVRPGSPHSYPSDVPPRCPLGFALECL